MLCCGADANGKVVSVPSVSSESVLNISGMLEGFPEDVISPSFPGIPHPHMSHILVISD
jgi:hypothetical protein